MRQILLHSILIKLTLIDTELYYVNKQIHLLSNLYPAYFYKYLI